MSTESTEHESTVTLTGAAVIPTNERTVSDVLAEGAYNRTVITELIDWLEDYLKINGRVKSQDVKKAATKEGFTESTLKRAAGKLKVIITSKGYPRVTYWTLPGIEICEGCSKPVKEDQPELHRDCPIDLDEGGK